MNASLRSRTRARRPLKKMHSLRHWLCRVLGCRRSGGSFDWQLGAAQPKAKHMLETKITNEQKIRLTVAPVTATGRPAQLDGEVAIETQSGNATAVRVDDRTFDLVSSDLPGDTVFVVSADADLGEGVETISDVVKLTVEGARAASLGLSLGTPEAK